jgi:hypothetical protein
VACVSFWAFKVMVSGANNWQQLFLSATLLDVSRSRCLHIIIIIIVMPDHDIGTFSMGD